MVVRRAAETPGRQRLDARRLLHRDGAEGVHDAPDRAEEAEERGAGDDRGEEDHVGLVAQRLRASARWSAFSVCSRRKREVSMPFSLPIAAARQ
jgi:hypothetical protein